ncbi:MAG: hypothetical protein WEA77_12265 [Hyphomonas sp.]|uniref:hypothetical protein n=1 Tax=Hyphomonas sp. TaxID=87 RepID=UPI0034A00716
MEAIPDRLGIPHEVALDRRLALFVREIRFFGIVFGPRIDRRDTSASVMDHFSGRDLAAPLRRH